LLLKSFSVKVKVLGGGFGLWLGDNIAILSMVKRAHVLFLTGYGPTLSLDSLTTGRYIGRIFSVTVAFAVNFCCSNETLTLLLRHLK
jgi:hypothetical protein